MSEHLDSILLLWLLLLALFPGTDHGSCSSCFHRHWDGVGYCQHCLLALITVSCFSCFHKDGVMLLSVLFASTNHSVLFPSFSQTQRWGEATIHTVATVITVSRFPCFHRDGVGYCQHCSHSEHSVLFLLFPHRWGGLQSALFAGTGLSVLFSMFPQTQRWGQATVSTVCWHWS